MKVLSENGVMCHYTVGVSLRILTELLAIVRRVIHANKCETRSSVPGYRSSNRAMNLKCWYDPAEYVFRKWQTLHFRATDAQRLSPPESTTWNVSKYTSIPQYHSFGLRSIQKHYLPLSRLALVCIHLWKLANDRERLGLSQSSFIPHLAISSSHHPKSTS